VPVGPVSDYQAVCCPSIAKGRPLGIIPRFGDAVFFDSVQEHVARDVEILRGARSVPSTFFQRAADQPLFGLLKREVPPRIGIGPVRG
jgi:hypothetical protein